MNVTYRHCAGVDVHKKSVVVCCLTEGKGGGVEQETRTFSTLTDDLLAMVDWVVAKGVTQVALESTGEYWKPVYNVLEGRVGVMVVNAQHIKNVPGRKTDVQDAAWIAELLRHGLVRGSFSPDLGQRDLRDLTRQRTNVVGERTRVINRLQKVLEWANLKLGDVVSDVNGVSGRAILDALVEGQTDPGVMAQLARGRLRSKRKELEQALAGHVREHHRFMIAEHLADLDYWDEKIQRFNERITEHLAKAFASEGSSDDPPLVGSEAPPSDGGASTNATSRQAPSPEESVVEDLETTPCAYAALSGEEVIALLDTIPGVARRTAEVMVAEIGPSVAPFRSAKALASWAGLCPGNNESAGKRRSGRSTGGNPNLRTILVQAAQAAVRVKDCYLAQVYHRLAPRRGAKRAIFAVAHRILTAAYFMMVRREPYDDARLAARTKERSVENLRRRIERQGYIVTATPITATSG